MAFDWSQWSPPSGASPTDTAAWWGAHMASLQNALGSNYSVYTDQMASLVGQYTPWTAPAWEGSSQWTKYTGYQSAMDQLLSRIGAGPQASDLASANSAVAQMYGFSDASWTALQNSLPSLLNASNSIARAGDIAAAFQNSALGQQQQQALRVAERQATEGVGKQLEAIFGARGGLAGFQAAYDLTSQLQSSFMQQQSQNSLAIFDKAVAQVNAENGYYQDLINRGAVQAQDYLSFRWNALQQGYSDYANSMDQALKDWQVQEQVSFQQWQSVQDNISRQLDALDKELAAQMGIDDAALTAISTATGDAAKAAGSAEPSNQAGQLFGSGMQSVGGALFGAGLTTANVGLAVLGGVFYLFGGLINWLSGGK